MVCGPGCCCSVCGKKLATPNSLCCGCVCDALCVTIDGEVYGGVVECLPTTGTGSGETCGCVQVTTKVGWDDDECAWIGTVGCGGLSIDLKFEILEIDGDCYVCLTSDCLGLIQLRTGTGTGDECGLITPGCNSWEGESCGSYVKDGDQDGGINADWTVDASDCGDLMCGSIDINAVCADRTNPAGKGIDRLCIDCDCVCNCICITYLEDTACGVQIVQSCMDSWTGTGSNRWEHTFAGCPGGDQTVTISLKRRDSDGCCLWELETTRGSVTNPEQKAACPDATHTWNLTGLDADAAGAVDIACAECNECKVQTGCCQDPLPMTLTGTIVPTASCGSASGTVSFSVFSIEEIPPAGTKVTYKGSATICGGAFEYELDCDINNWVLRNTSVTGGDCVNGSPSLKEPSCCQPIYLYFEVAGVNCTACCDPLGSFDIIITE